MTRVGAVVLSDYAKGTLTPRVIRAVIDAANERGKPVVVDPKGRDYGIYRGATLITPNRQELADATRRTAVTDDEIAAAAKKLREELRNAGRSCDAQRSRYEPHGQRRAGARACLSGAREGCFRRRRYGRGRVSAMLAMRADFEAAMRAANAAAAVVVGKRGTATASVAELRSRILPAATLAPEEKIVFDWNVLDDHLPTGANKGCGSASPMAASICCIRATSNYWPVRVRPAIGSSSASTATAR